jgi:hypothetical protein
MKSGERGAALLEFAMAMPFALLLFAGIADFGGYFWQQTELEALSRRAAARIGPARAGWAAAGEREFQSYASNLETELRGESGRKGLRVQSERRYSCPDSGGGERELGAAATGCAGERVYVAMRVSEATAPLLGGLRHIGFPPAAECRHTLRVR